MPTIPISNFGVVKFMPVESFEKPERGLDKEARSDMIMERLEGELQPQSVGDWPRIHTAIRRGDLFVIESSTPNFIARLSFSPASLDVGDYQINYLPRGRVDKGRIDKITPIKEDEKDNRVSMLSRFTERFAVVTVGSERPRVRLIWLVGLNSFTVVDVDVNINEEAV
jgi:hypothetical protein